MAKRRRRDQQHLNQQTARNRSYAAGGANAGEKYKPPFPFNLLQNAKVFYIIGAVVMIGGVIIAAVAGSRGTNDNDLADIETIEPTATVTGTITPEATGTPNPLQFTAAEDVLEQETNTYTATITTAKGDIVLELFADEAPNTVNAFAFLAGKGYFDGITFHRVVEGFVAQAGDPTGDGTGGPGFQTEEEPNQLLNTRGMVSMAKTSGATAFGSQFFINLDDNPALDVAGNRFYPWAEVIEGMDVVDQLVQGDVIESVTIEAQPKPSASPAATP